MNIKTLLENLNALPIFEFEKDVWPFVNALGILYGDTLGFDEWQLEAVEEFTQMPNLSMHVVFDFLHHSDECCFVNVIGFNGVPMALVHKFADEAKSDYTLLNRDAYLELGKLLASHVLERKLKEQEAEMAEEGETQLQSLAELPNGYIKWHSEEAGLFSMESPRWMHRFTELPKKYDAVVQTEDGTIHQVESIRFANEVRNGESPSDDVEVRTVAGCTLQMRGQDVAFFLLRQSAPILSARRACADRDEWQIKGVFRRSGLAIVRIDQFNRGKFAAQRRRAVAIERDGVMAHPFMQKYGSVRQRGEFLATEHGFQAD